MKRAAAPAKTPKLAARVPVRTALGRVKPATARWVAKLEAKALVGAEAAARRRVGAKAYQKKEVVSNHWLPFW